MAEESADTGRASSRWRRIRWLLVAVAVCLAASAGVLVLVGSAAGPTTAEGRSAALTTIITRTTLIDIVTVPGRLGFGPQQLIESRLPGTITGLPPVGTVIDRGGVLFRVDDKPVVLLTGALPAYRELSAGRTAESSSPAPGTDKPAAEVPASRGADVKQFEENLAALGYSGLTIDEHYTSQTATVVRRWQRDLGLDQTGVVELGRVVYAPGPVRVAEHKLTPGAVANGPVLAYTGSARLVIAEVKEADQELAKPQTTVRIALSGGNDITGTVVSSAARQDAQPGAERERTLDVVVAMDGPAAGGRDNGSVSVRFVRQERKDVLAVPIGALLALADGGYGLELIEGSSSRVVAVTTGLFAGGNVEVSGPDLRDGATVGTAQ